MKRIRTLKSVMYWFRFAKRGYGICLTKRENLLFSFRIGKKKYLSVGNWVVYILLPYTLD